MNEIIDSDLDIIEEFKNIEEAAKLYDISKLPKSSGNDIRIIKIGNYDACPCIGQHVKSTGEIGAFKIISTNYSDKILRIRFKLNN
ncbi:alanyl-tRNA synthetase [bacterium BMS3Abin04]|nr:alanyl-tRNA synthetase [bacterium BMS3Abin04]